MLLPLLSKAQVGIINTIAGNGTTGFSGDGGPATAAGLYIPYGLAIDYAGNIYTSQSGDGRIRKITPRGVITTIAGNGSSGYSGDGGRATAASLFNPKGLSVDRIGNLYIADFNNHRVRKVDTSGIITTIAGNGSIGHSGDGGAAVYATLSFIVAVTTDTFGNIYVTDSNRIRKIDTYTGVISTVAGNGYSGYSGDGGVATSAQIDGPTDIVFDNLGSLYIADRNNNSIRKVDQYGIITTIAGNDTAGYRGDGGQATTAELYHPTSVAVDGIGYIYISDYDNYRVRVVDNFGVINTLAGTGSSGYAGDGAPATVAMLYQTSVLRIDNAGKLYVVDMGNYRLRTVTSISPVLSDSFSIYVSSDCGGMQFGVITKCYLPGHHVKTYFGNGDNFDTTTSLHAAFGFAHFSEAYRTSGSYTIKHVLFNGITAIDSITYNKVFLRCEDINVNFFYDANGNCAKDSDERATLLPVNVEIDSNGVHIATVSCTNGFHFPAYGAVSDIYSFRVLTAPSGLFVSCPSSGIVTDTLSGGLSNTKYFGFSCIAGTSPFDLIENVVRSWVGRHGQSVSIILNNIFCNAVAPTLTMSFSPHYHYNSATLAPSSVVGNVVTWNLGTISAISPGQNFINISLEVSGSWLTVGDTVHTRWVLSPLTGDIDTTNNVIFRVDTVIGSFDPNEMSVTPAGNILPGAQLQYTVNFENTGNDTAFNIYVMDTLSDNVDPGSMRIVAASHAMTTSQFYDTTIHHNIIKFEFPNINLLDSSHHNLCDGMVIFNINSNSGLPDGATIQNHAGIFFDYNAVVMTDTVVNTIALIHGGSVVCVGATDTLSDLAPAGVWSLSNSHASVSASGIVTGVTGGFDTVTYTVTYANGPITTQTVIRVDTLPDPGTLSGADSFCVAGTIVLTASVGSGAWHSTTGLTTVSGAGHVTGVSAGTETIVYVVSNTCGVDSETKNLIVKPLPFAGGITGADSVCTGASITLHDTVVSGAWSASNSHATVVAGAITGVTAGTDTIRYMITNYCGVDTAVHIVTINPLPNAGVISGTDSVCTGSSITLSETVSGGVWGMTNGRAIVYSGMVSGISIGLDSVQYVYTNTCGRDTAALFNIKVLTVPARPGILGGALVCAGRQPDTLNGIPAGGVWSSLNTHATVVAGLVTGITSGLDTIVYSITNYCGTTSDSFYVTIPSVSDCDSIAAVDPLTRDEDTKIYPNPATHELTIGATAGFYTTCTLTDVLGKELIHQKLTGTQTHINIRQLPAGVFYVQLKGDGVTLVRKIVKM